MFAKTDGIETSLVYRIWGSRDSVHNSLGVARRLVRVIHTQGLPCSTLARQSLDLLTSYYYVCQMKEWQAREGPSSAAGPAKTPRLALLNTTTFAMSPVLRWVELTERGTLRLA